MSRGLSFRENVDILPQFIDSQIVTITKRENDPRHRFRDPLRLSMTKFHQTLSQTPGGPPKLRLTAIEIPEPGFRPSERVEETCRRLANYRRFNVPFEYNTIVQKWETIRCEDLKLHGNDELTVVNALSGRLRHLHDETVVESNPRGTVLKLIKRIKPRVFFHGVVNGSYDTPFLETRFREALFHYWAYFDMFEASVGPKDRGRMVFEEAIYGREIRNVIACEGRERIERPESYKQWQAL